MAVAVALAMAVAHGEEMWIVPITFEECNLSDTLRPYLLIEGDIPPAVIDVEQLVQERWTAASKEQPTPEELQEYKNMIVENFFTVETYESEAWVVPVPFLEGFEQRWMQGASSWRYWCQYGLLRFEDEDDALYWYLKNLQWAKESAKASNWTLEEYPVGERAILAADPSGAQKNIYVKMGTFGFAMVIPINVYQPDEMLAEKLGRTILAKIPEASVSLAPLLGIISVLCHSLKGQARPRSDIQA